MEASDTKLLRITAESHMLLWLWRIMVSKLNLLKSQKMSAFNLCCQLEIKWTWRSPLMKMHSGDFCTTAFSLLHDWRVYLDGDIIIACNMLGGFFFSLFPRWFILLYQCASWFLSLICVPLALVFPLGFPTAVTQMRRVQYSVNRIDLPNFRDYKDRIVKPNTTRLLAETKVVCVHL